MKLKTFSSPRTFLPKQAEVLEAIKKYKYVLYSGAFGAGKTLLMCIVAIETCLNNPNVFGFFGSQTVPLLRDTVVRTFLQEMDLYQDTLKENGIGLKLEKKWSPSIMTYKFYNGSDIVFRSCDEPSKFKSLNLDFFILDEPVDIPDEVFLMLQGRLRGTNIKKPNGESHRFGAMAGNPSGKMNWVYQRFFEHQTPNYYYVHTRTKDNTYLPSDYISSMYDAYDFEYAQRYLEGEWGSFIGLVYKGFNYDKHVGNFKDKEVKYYMLGVDVGYNNPTAMLVAGIDYDDKVYIVEEYYEDKKTTDVTVETAAGWNNKYNFRKVYPDPSAADWKEKARNLHLRVAEADNDIDKGVAKCKSLFYNDMIYIDSSCKFLIKELESYQYDKKRVMGNEPEKPMKRDDHAVDALRYVFSDFNPWHKRRSLTGGSW